MATKLLKPLKRELLAVNRGKTLIAELLPGDLISFRVKGKRTRYTVSLHKVFSLALMQFLLENYKNKSDEYKVKKKLGYQRIRRPHPPGIHIFAKELQIALK